MDTGSYHPDSKCNLDGFGRAWLYAANRGCAADDLKDLRVAKHSLPKALPKPRIPQQLTEGESAEGSESEL